VNGTAAKVCPVTGASSGIGHATALNRTLPDREFGALTTRSST
jgi:NADP-dependent 3-hydroxy acid dehydrogenase YdfG